MVFACVWRFDSAFYFPANVNVYVCVCESVQWNFYNAKLIIWKWVVAFIISFLSLPPTDKQTTTAKTTMKKKKNSQRPNKNQFISCVIFSFFLSFSFAFFLFPNYYISKDLRVFVW